MKKLLAVVVAFVMLGFATPGPAAASQPSVGRVLHSLDRPVTSGVTVDATSGRRVPFVIVIAYDEDYSTVIGWTISNVRGRFRIAIDDEEFALRYIGRLTRHETGWQACDRSVVPTSGEACTQGPGPQGSIRLDRL